MSMTELSKLKEELTTVTDSTLNPYKCQLLQQYIVLNEEFKRKMYKNESEYEELTNKKNGNAYYGKSVRAKIVEHMKKFLSDVFDYILSHKTELLLYISNFNEHINLSKESFLNKILASVSTSNKLSSGDYDTLTNCNNKVLDTISLYMPNKHESYDSMMAELLEQYKMHVDRHSEYTAKIAINRAENSVIIESQNKSIIDPYNTEMLNAIIVHKTDVYFEETNPDLYDKIITFRANWMINGYKCVDCGNILPLSFDLLISTCKCDKTKN